MKYYSLTNKNIEVSFKDAVIKGIASDRGLFFPKEIKPLSTDFWNNLDNLSNAEIAFILLKQFVDNIDDTALKTIIKETLCFDFPVVKITKNTYTLELFHGPTMAFKDVGARFMARCLQHFKIKNKVTVLVATSGDTGGAVASGFLDVKDVNVVILYPKNKVTDIQEKQLTTLGKNIKALEVTGTFDDCQEMVKTAFLDAKITNNMQLTSANSINVARWLPQLLYFVFAYKELKTHNKELVFSVPSGNFGNICAGFMAQKLGMPVVKIIAATNKNDVVLRYLKTKKYEPIKSFATISNAMDVGNPSNFIRIQELFNQDFELLSKHLVSYSYTDEETKTMIKNLFKTYNYIADPHGAIGFLGLQDYGLQENEIGVFLETAHPIKFAPTVEPIIQEKLEIPQQIASVLTKEKVAIEISTYNELKTFLLDNK